MKLKICKIRLAQTARYMYGQRDRERKKFGKMHFLKILFV